MSNKKFDLQLRPPPKQPKPSAQQHTLLLSQGSREEITDKEAPAEHSSRQHTDQFGKQGSETTLQHDDSFLNMPKGQGLALDPSAQQHASQPRPKAQSSVLGLAERDQQRALATEGDLDQAIRDVNHEIARMDNNMTPINLTSPQETSAQNAGAAAEGTGKSMGMVVPSVQVSIPVKQQQSKPTGPSKRKLTSKMAASTGKSA